MGKPKRGIVPGEREAGPGQTPKRGVIGLFDEALIPHIQVKRTRKLKEAVDNVAMGGTAFFFEGEEEAVLVDAKTLLSLTKTTDSTRQPQ